MIYDKFLSKVYFDKISKYSDTINELRIFTNTLPDNQGVEYILACINDFNGLSIYSNKSFINDISIEELLIDFDSVFNDFSNCYNNPNGIDTFIFYYSVISSQIESKWIFENGHCFNHPISEMISLSEQIHKEYPNPINGLTHISNTNTNSEIKKLIDS